MNKSELKKARTALRKKLRAAEKELREAEKNLAAAEEYLASFEEGEETAEAVETRDGWKDAADALRASVEETTKAIEEIEEQLKEKPVREKRNGITRPVGKGPSATVWRVADEITEQKGSPAAFREVEQKLEEFGIKPNTMRAAYHHWRKFHGLSGRITPAEDAKAA